MDTHVAARVSIIAAFAIAFAFACGLRWLKPQAFPLLAFLLLLCFAFAFGLASLSTLFLIVFARFLCLAVRAVLCGFACFLKYYAFWYVSIHFL